MPSGSATHQIQGMADRRASPAHTVLITGATGFIGGRLARRLVADGDLVHAVVRRPDGDPLVAALMADGVACHRHDGTLASMRAIVGAAKPDVVFHLATRFVGTHQDADIEPLVRDNIAFGAQLLEAVRQLPNPRLVDTGSAYQHVGNADYSPASLYAATKEAFSAIVEFYATRLGVRVVTLELGDTYGQGDTRRKLIPLMLEAERTGKPMQMVPADTLIDLVYVDDAVEAFVIAGTRTSIAAGRETFAVRSGAPVTVAQLFEHWAAARGKRLDARWGARPASPTDATEPWTRGVVLPEWVPRVALESGLSGVSE